MMSDIIVSIICNAYNHEKYIKDALDGFVMQKTNFKFEVLVHDDASTDGTADMIKEYEDKYPEIIKPIYSKENQYSKKDGSLRRIQFERVKGKYIAICEGDDYWTDPYKLQKQYDAMEKHPEIDICAHASRCEINGELGSFVKPYDEDTIIPFEKVLVGNGFNLVSTATLFYRAVLNNNIPEYRKNFGVDYALQVQGAARGGMLYLSDCMSVYRKFTESSWSTRMKQDPYKHILFREKTVDLYMGINEYYNYKYDYIMSKLIKSRVKNILTYIFCNKPELSVEYVNKYKGILNFFDYSYLYAFSFLYKFKKSCAPIFDKRK